MLCWCLTPNLCVYFTEFLTVSLSLTRGNMIFPTKWQTTSILNRSMSRVNYVDYVLKGWEHFSHQSWMSRSTWVHFYVNAEGSASISCVHIDTHLLKRERGNRGFSATVFYTKELLFVLRKGFCSWATQVCTPQSETQLKKLNGKSYFTNTTPSLQQLDIKITWNKRHLQAISASGF